MKSFFIILIMSWNVEAGHGKVETFSETPNIFDNNHDCEHHLFDEIKKAEGGYTFQLNKQSNGTTSFTGVDPDDAELNFTILCHEIVYDPNAKG
jgi:hypothetical protein